MKPAPFRRSVIRPAVIEITDRKVRAAVLLAGRGKPFDPEWVATPIKDPGETAVRLALDQLLAQITPRPHRVILSLSRQHVILKFVKMPSQDESEIRQMAQHEMLKQLPYSTEEIVCGFKIERLLPDGHAHVMIAAVHRNILLKQLSLLKQAGCVVDKIVLGLEGLVLALVALDSSLPQKNVFSVVVGSHCADILALEKGSLSFARNVVWDAVQPPETLADEVRVSSRSFQSAEETQAWEILVIGSGREAELFKALSQEMKWPMRVLNPMAQMPFSKNSTSAGDNSFLSLFGTLAAPNDCKVDLMPGELRLEIDKGEYKKQVNIFLLLLALVFMLTSGSPIFSSWIHRRTLLSLEKNIGVLAPKVAETEKMIHHLSLLEEAYQGPLAVEVFADVHRLTSSGIKIDSYAYEKKDALVMRGAASGLREVFDYAKQLEESQFLSESQVRYATKKSMSGTEQIDFEISVKVADAI